MGFPNELIQKLRQAIFNENAGTAFTTLSSFNRKIENKEVYDFQYIFTGVAAGAKVYVSLRTPSNARMHLVVVTTTEEDAVFKSYQNTTWTADGTQGDTFNRFINEAPASVCEIYYGGTPNVLGSNRFNILLPGGSGPFSSGASVRSDSESILAESQELTIEVENTSTGAQDINVTLEWFEERV